MALKLFKEVKVGLFQPGEAAWRLFEDPNAPFAHHGVQQGASTLVDFPAFSNFL